MLRTHTCGELKLSQKGTEVVLCGWVQRVRNLGKFIFIDLRDRYGITQINVSASDQENFSIARDLGREFVILVEGKVVERESKNLQLPTGEIEIIPSKIDLLNTAKLPPFKIEDETDGLEDLRLQYRYLDLRRNRMAENLKLRAKVNRAIRNYLDGQGFMEVETPVLIKSTPEGARDFLVPSRLQKGSFYALPQSPQMLKQLLMVGGIDRYYQIVKCFRDEDFRGDRQPEFTQLDCEMSFVEQEDILQTFEALTKHVFKEVIEVSLPDFPRISYREALAKYGSDKPDLRFGCEIVELNESLSGTDFQVFAKVIQNKGLIAGLNAKGCATYSRKQIDQLTDFVRAPHRGASGLVWIKWNEDGSFKSSIDKFFTGEQLRQLAVRMQAEPGDLLLILAGQKSKVRKVLGDLRLELADRENWRKPGDWSVLWVVDFPLFERDEETQELIFSHHPFVMPRPQDLSLLDTNPEGAIAQSYDLVMNGNEILSGSVRIHNQEIQEKIFQLLGLSDAEIEEQFGFLLNAFKYGAPPHAGCAFGLDRWVMLMSGSESIRDVMAFPKNSAGRDMMLDAPAAVSPEALQALAISVEKTKEEK